MCLKNMFRPLLTVMLVLAVPALSYALDMEYITYGGYDAIVNSFNQMALIFANNSYKALFFTLMTAGLFFGGITYYMKAFMGVNAGSPYAWVVPAVVGIVIYLAMVVPKGNLIIYDELYNRHITVAGIPDGVVMVVGVLNKIETGLIDIVMGTSVLGESDYRKHAGGKGFLGLQQMTSMPLTALNASLDQSMRQFIKDCVTPALTDPSSGISVDSLRQKSVKKSEIAKAINPAFYTVYYSDTDPVGTAKSCTAAWSDLNTALVAASVTPKGLKTVCAAMGFNPNNNSEMTDCKNRMQDILTSAKTGKMTSVVIEDFLMQAYIGQRLEEVYRSGDSTAASNYGFMMNASGVMKQANEWIPTMKSAMTAIAVGLIPFLALFIPTPLFGRGIGLMMGFFVWLTCWGVTDAIIHGYAIDYAAQMYEQINQVRLGAFESEIGMDGLLFYPTQNAKILAMFGTLRMSGMMLATVLSGALVKFGGSAMAHMAGGLTGQVQASAVSGEMSTADAPGRAGAVGRAMEVAPTQAWTNQFSYGQRSDALTTAKVGGTASGLGTMAAAGGIDGVSRIMGAQAYQGTNKMAGDNKNYDEGMQIGASLGLNNEQLQTIRARSLSAKDFRDTMAATQQHTLKDPVGTGLQGMQGNDLFAAMQGGYTQSATPATKTGFADNYSSWQFSSFLDPISGAGSGVVTNGQQTMNWAKNADGQWRLTGISGVNNQLVGGEAWQVGAKENIKNAIQRTEGSSLEIGRGITSASTNSAAGSEISSLIDGIRTTTSGGRTLREDINHQTGEAIKNASKVTDSKGREVSQSAWASISAKLGLGSNKKSAGEGEGVSKVGSLGFGADGGMKYQVTAKDGTTYTVDLGKEQSEALNKSIGKTVHDTYEKAKSSGADHTTMTNFSKLFQVSQTQNAAEKLSTQNQTVQAMERALDKNHNVSTAATNDLKKQAYSWLAQQWHGEVTPQSVAAAAGRVENMKPAEAQAAMNAFLLSDNSLLPSVDRLPEAKGIVAPDPAQMPVMGTAAGQFQAKWSALEKQQQEIPQPNVPVPGAVSGVINGFSPSQGVTDITHTPPSGHSVVNQVQTGFSLTGGNIRQARENWAKASEDLGGLFNVPGAQMTSAEKLKNGEGPNQLSFLSPVNEGIGVVNQGVRSLFRANSLDASDFNLAPNKPLDKQLGDFYAGNLGHKPAPDNYAVPSAGSATKGSIEPQKSNNRQGVKE